MTMAPAREAVEDNAGDLWVTLLNDALQANALNPETLAWALSEDATTTLRWIVEHIEAFQRVVPYADRYKFLERYCDNAEMVHWVLNPEFLRLMTQSSHEDFVVAVVSQHPIESDEWLPVARQFNVSPRVLADLVLLQLSDQQFGADHVRRLTGRYISPGPDGEIRQPTEADDATLWSVLNSEQLVEAMKITARWHHKAFLTPEPNALRRFLNGRGLLPSQLQAILDHAAAHLHDLEGVSINLLLTELSVEQRIKLANRGMPGSLEYLVRLLLTDVDDLPPRARPAEPFSTSIKLDRRLFDKCIPHPHEGSGISPRVACGQLYIRLQDTINLARLGDETVLAQSIDGHFRRVLRDFGYVVGELSWGKYQGVSVLTVQDDLGDRQVTYVQDRSGGFDAGDRVIADPGTHSRPLTRDGKTVRVHFTLVCRKGDIM